MSITDELRVWAKEHLSRSSILAIADRIDAEHHKAEDEWRAKNDDMWLKGYAACHEELMEGHPVIAADLEKAGWVKLPVDADGEVIHVGDAMERGDAHGRVIALMLSNYPKKWGGSLHWSIQLEGEHAPTALDLTFHHSHAPTVEDVLLDACKAYHSLMVESMSDVAHDMPAPSEVIAEFAAKLRLAGDAE